MGKKYASYYRREANETLQRGAIIEETTVEGDRVVWNITTISGAYNLTVADYDNTRMGEYTAPNDQPHIIIKNSANASQSNVTLLNADGDTLYTFDSDCSSTPIYVVLRLKDSGRSWELA